MSEQVNFSSLNLPIPDIVKIYPYEKKREIFDYLFSMTEIEKEGYKIAFNHLEILLSQRQGLIFYNFLQIC